MVSDVTIQKQAPAGFVGAFLHNGVPNVHSHQASFNLSPTLKICPPYESELSWTWPI